MQNGTFPVRTTSRRVLLDTQPTDFCLSLYSDRIVLFVTQTGTFGSVFLVTTVVDGEGDLDVNIRPLLGRRDQEELLLCVRRVAVKLTSLQPQQSMILCFAFRERMSPSIAQIRQIVEVVIELLETIKEQ